MTTNDIKQISTLIDEKFKTFGDRFDKQFEAVDKRFDNFDKQFEAVDKKITQTETRLKKEISASSKKVTDDIGNFIQETLLPMFNERFEDTADKSDTDRIERKLDKLNDTDLDHEKRIKDIEAAPVIAHQLRYKKLHK